MSYFWVDVVRFLEWCRLGYSKRAAGKDSRSGLFTTPTPYPGMETLIALLTSVDKNLYNPNSLPRDGNRSGSFARRRALSTLQPQLPTQGWKRFRYLATNPAVQQDFTTPTPYPGMETMRFWELFPQSLPLQPQLPTQGWKRL